MGRLTAIQRKQLIEEYCQGIPSTDLSLKFDVSIQAICALLQRRGRERRTHSESTRKYTLNEHVFDSISEYSAYWCGFLMADGTILNNGSENEYVIILALAEIDIYHLEKFKLFLQANSPITQRAREKTGYQES